MLINVQLRQPPVQHTFNIHVLSKIVFSDARFRKDAVVGSSLSLILLLQLIVPWSCSSMAGSLAGSPDRKHTFSQLKVARGGQVGVHLST